MRDVTDRLYGGDTEHRIRQEILLGIGGVRALRRARHRRRRCSTRTRATPASSASSACARARPSRACRSPRPSRRCGPAACSPPTRRCRRASTASREQLMEHYFGDFAERVRRHHRRADGPRPPRRRARRAASTWRSWACASPAVRTAWPSCTATVSRRDVRRPLARRARRGGADHLGHQRRARARPGSSPEIDDLLARYVLPGLGPRPAPDEWERVHDVRDDELWRAREQGRSGSCARPRPPAQRRAGPGLSASRRRLDRRGARPEGAHDRLRPPLRHLQAGHAAAVAARRGCKRPAARRRTGRCSSCSPARPTRPTSRARR